MTMKILKVACAIAAMLCLMLVNDASAQCSGQFLPGYFCGNATGSTALPKAVSISPSLTATNHSVLVGTGAFGFAASQGATISSTGLLSLSPSDGIALGIGGSLFVNGNTTFVDSGTHSLTSVTWSGGVATATAAAPHGIPVSQNFCVTIASEMPSGYNGSFPAISTGSATFTYSLVSNPGSQTVAGTYTRCPILPPALINTQIQYVGPTTVYQDFASATAQARNLIYTEQQTNSNFRQASVGIKSLIKGSGAAGGPANNNMLLNITAVKWAQDQNPETAWYSSTLVAPGEIDPVSVTVRQGGPPALPNPVISSDTVAYGADGLIAGTSGFLATMESSMGSVDFDTGAVNFLSDIQLNIVNPRDGNHVGFAYAIAYPPGAFAEYGIVIQDGVGIIGKPFAYQKGSGVDIFYVDTNGKITAPAVALNATTNTGYSLTDTTVTGTITTSSLFGNSIKIQTDNAHNLLFGTNNTLAAYIDTSQALHLGFQGISQGAINFHGNGGGVVTVAVQASGAGTYNFNLPTTAGSAGQVLTSQGGVGAAMTWTSVGGTGTVTSINTTGPLTIVGGGGPITASGTIDCPTCVISSVTMTLNQLIVGQGGQGVAPLGALGTTTTLLHGNATGAPSFGAVALGTDVSGTLPAANGGTGVANNAANTLTWSGAFGATFTLTNTTTVTFPTTGTLATTGGANIPTIAQGDLLYGSAANVLSALAKNTNPTRYLSNTGTTSNPAWAQIDLTNGVTNALAIANGGTGQTAKAAAFDALSPMSAIGDLIYGGTAGTGTRLAGTATARQMLQSGASAAPTWSTTVWPATATTVGRLLYVSALNTISDLTMAASSILVTDGSSIPSLSTTLPAHTLGGTISGGANQINNVVIGTTNPLAGSFTTLAATSETISAAAGTVTALTVKAGGNTSGDAPSIDFTSLAGSTVARTFTDATGTTTRIKALGELVFHAGDIGFTATNPYLQIMTTGAITMPSIAASGTITGSICHDSAGQLITQAAATCVISSARFKENIEDLTHGIDWVMAFKPKTYNYRDGYFRNARAVGMIAEDVFDVASVLTLVDGDGNPYTIQTEMLPAVLVKAIQQQQAQIDRLIADNDNLKLKRSGAQ